MLLNGAEVEDDGTKEPGAPSGSRRVLMASGALTLAFACGALAVAMVLGKDTPAAAAQQPFIGPLPPMPRDEEDYKWMEHPGLVHMPTKRHLGELLNAIKDIYPDGADREVWDQVKYLDIDHSDPENLKFDYNMKLFKNATDAHARKLQQNIEQVPPDDVGKLDVMRQMLWALCGIDAFQILSSIGQIVTNIRTVTVACKSPYPMDANQQDFCAAMVQLNLAIWGYIAIYIEDMVSSCGPTFNIQAGCAIDMTGFMANAALVGAAGANMRSSCLPRHGYWDERIAKIEGGSFPGAISASTLTRGQTLFGPSSFTAAQLEKINKEIQETRDERIRQNDRFRSQSSAGRGFRRLEEATAELAAGLATLPADPAASQQAKAMSDVEAMKTGAADALEKISDASDPDDKEFIDDKVKHAADRMGLTSDEIIAHKKKETEKTWKHVQCGFDLSKAVARLAQLGTLVAMSTKDCGAYNFEVNGHQGKTKCAIDVTGAIASAGIAASMITLSVINCPGAVDFTRAMGERLCAAAIIDLVSATTYIGTSIASVQSTCGSLDNYPGVPGT